MREFYFVLFESCVNKGKNDFIRKFFWKSVLDVICDLLKKKYGYLKIVILNIVVLLIYY